MSDAITVDLPEPVKREVERLARERGVSPEEFVVGATAEKVGAIQSAAAYFAERAARAKPGALKRVFGTDREGGEPPRPGDEAD